jgi:hypothetical protein
MAVRPLLDGISFNETVAVEFSGLAAPINFTFTRDGDVATITIPHISFVLSQPGFLKSTSDIPSQYIPAKPSTGWFVLTGGTYTLCNFTIDQNGVIYIYNGSAGTNFPAMTVFISNSNNFITYLV